ncbi:hypothetical protein BANRA_00500 [Escherichia coli]|nr:hypothetical protein BANRA_00500 [Escherichia coli]
MHLKCPQCGSCNTLISSAGKLPSITDNKRSGYISLEFLPEILKEIIKAIKKLFGFLEQCKGIMRQCLSVWTVGIMKEFK